jgi:predicted CXXCH cytochrome family protein
MPSIRHRLGGAIAIAALVHIAVQAGQQKAPPSPADYVGDDACLSCHEAQSYKGTAHALTANPRTPASTRGCESCHGAGKAHADAGGDTAAIVNPRSQKPEKASETCTGCHERVAHVPCDGRQYDERAVGCTTCHSIHTPSGPKMITARTKMDLCAAVDKRLVVR